MARLETTSPWRLEARQMIAAILAALPEGAGEKARRRALKCPRPFSAVSHGRKMWSAEKALALGEAPPHDGPPPLTLRGALLQAVWVALDDSLPRLVLADHAEEQDQAREAAFWRWTVGPPLLVPLPSKSGRYYCWYRPANNLTPLTWGSTAEVPAAVYAHFPVPEYRRQMLRGAPNAFEALRGAWDRAGKGE